MTRRLAAILVADIAGYSRLMHKDEAATHARFTRVMASAVEPAIAQHGGRLVKSMGDGFLAEFPSAVEAVAGALQFQTGAAALDDTAAADRAADRADDRAADAALPMAFRVGIHIGEVIIERQDIYGDGVNIAARLDGLAEPGGIVVSEAVYENVRGRLPCGFEDLGVRQVKNIDRPVRLFRVVPAAEAGHSAPGRPPAAARPSIVVLPFQNLSGDPAQDDFATGIVEDLTNALARFHALFVIARKSAFAYRGRDVDVRQVGRELGARYVVEGSLRKVGSRLRISGQAAQAETGAQLWAGRHDCDLVDIFAAQDQATTAIVSGLMPAVERAEIERARRRAAASLDAYDLYLRALAAHRTPTRAGNEEARALIQRTLALDPHFVPALVLAEAATAVAVANGWLPRAALAHAPDYARLAVELAPEDAEALAALALRTAATGEDGDQAVVLAERAIVANPHSASVWRRSGYACLYAGQAAQALRLCERAERLGADDDLTWSGIGYALLSLGRDDEALEAARLAAHHNPGSTDACRIQAAALALADRADEAAAVVRRLLALDPSCCIETVRQRFGAAQAGARLLLGLRRAGLGLVAGAADTDDLPTDDGGTVMMRPRAEAGPRRTLLISQPGAPAREVAIGATPLLIGRAADADVQLADNKVSRAHCRIAVAGGEVTATDLDSTNGTYLGGLRIVGTTTLRSGDVLMIGSCRLDFLSEAPADPDGTIGMGSQDSLSGLAPRRRPVR